VSLAEVWVTQSVFAIMLIMVLVLFTIIGVGERTAVSDARLDVGLAPLRKGTELERIAQHLGLRKFFGLPSLQEGEFSRVGGPRPGQSPR
jgi:hypothetical protein